MHNIVVSFLVSQRHGRIAVYHAFVFKLLLAETTHRLDKRVVLHSKPASDNAQLNRIALVLTGLSTLRVPSEEGVCSLPKPSRRIPTCKFADETVHCTPTVTMLTHGSPPEVVGSSNNYPLDQRRSARLLTPARPKVDDLVFYQLADLGQNLNLCENGNYDGSFVITQQIAGAFRQGFEMTHLISCGTDSYAAGTPISDTDAQWVERGQTGSPANPDDCNRLCAWLYIRWSDAPGNQKDSLPRCESWDWAFDSAASANKCFMYNSRIVNSDNMQKSTTPRDGVVVSGGNARNLKQSSYLTSWKRSLTFGESSRYKRNLWVQERSEDFMKPDLILPATL